jgi:outer membrane protein OmpA-like peptidoglycan-associated protein
MMAERTRTVLAAALLISNGQAIQGQDTASAGPWDHRTEVSAEAAVARLGAKRALEIRPIVLVIQGLGGGTTATGRAIVSTVAAVQQAKRALSATETPLEVRVALPADVLFDFDKAELRADAVDALTRLATLVDGYAGSTATIEGHTDSIGGDAYNQSLSERRAASVKRWLAEHAGIAPSRITTRGWGRSHPVASNSTETERQRNRRVEVIIRKTADPRTAP